MRLAASLMVGQGETIRYLREVLEHLIEFCDEIVIRLDGEQEWPEYEQWTWVRRDPRFHIHAGTVPFFEHEGRARQELLDFTLAVEPTYVLAIDADEFVSDGQAIRAACEADVGNGAWTLNMEEVWAADQKWLWTRQDGGWRSHPVPILYRVPERRNGLWRIQDRELACGREPMAVRQLAARGVQTGVSVFHFGWANRAERKARYDRYAEADGGKFHASSHLASILFPDRRVRLARKHWPPELEPYRETLVARANREAVAA